MKVHANVSVGAVCRALGADMLDGAQIVTLNIAIAYRRDGEAGITTFQRKGGDRLIVRHAEVEAAEALDAMSDHERENLPDWECSGCRMEELHDRDLRDFVAACFGGDRQTALALLPRLFSASRAETAEQMLLSHHARAA